MLHLLHVTPSFAPGGAQVRIANLMNRFGDGFRHTVTALDGNDSASALVSEKVAIGYATCRKTRNPGKMIVLLAAVMRRVRPDLVLTYNWGSMDAVAAAALCRIPIVHTEDGFGADEAHGQKVRRIWARRILLRLAERVVAPSLSLTRIMTNQWKLPAARILQIPNGVDIAQFRPAPTDYRRSLSKTDEFVVGTVGHLRPEKRQELLIRACAHLKSRFRTRLLIVGDGPERSYLEKTAIEAGMSGSVSFLGHRSDIAKLYWEFDLFALTSSTEQMPLSVLEAMACRLPVLSTGVGDIADMVSRENRPAIVPDLESFIQELEHLAADSQLRETLAAANRLRAEQSFSMTQMVSEYSRLYHSVAKNRPGWPPG